jgi:NTE family protein
MQSLEGQPRIGLALGGGGARGLAHIGVVKVLEREGIPVDLLAGTSMGGFIAACFAAGLTPADLEEEALHMAHLRNLLPLVDRSKPGLGLLKGIRVREYFFQHLGDRTFADLKVPLALVAVDLLTGEEVDLNCGLVTDAVRATVSLPGVLAPVRLGDRLLVDGGLLNNVPADVVRRMGADVVIAVDVSARLNGFSGLLEAEGQSAHRSAVPLIIETLQRSEVIMAAWILKRRLTEARPEVLIQPAVENSPASIADFHRAAEIISAGEVATAAAVPDIRQAIMEREAAS